MQRRLALLCALAALVLTSAAARAVTTTQFEANGLAVNGGTSQALVTLDNATLAGDRLLFITGIINRTEPSGGDSWLGIGINPTNLANPGSNVTTGTGGHLVRTNTTAPGTHQLFDTSAGASKSVAAAANFNQAAGASFVTSLRLSPIGIQNGEQAGLSFQIDEGNDGVLDRGLGGILTWNNNQANIRAAAQNKDHIVDIEIVSLSLQSVQPIQVFNTGVDNSGVALGGGVDDPHYDLIVDPSGLGDATVPSIPGAWIPNDADSRWIGPDDGNNGSGPGGEYIYRTTFTLPGSAKLDTAFLSGFWGADNGDDLLNRVFLNGQVVSIGNNGFGSATGLTPFAIAPGSPFQVGVNTLDFVLNNAGAGPTGLRVDDLIGGFVAVPEPATATLAMVAVGLLGRRRRRA